MKDEDMEKEIENRVGKEIAKKQLLSVIKEATTSAICEGYLTTKDAIEIMSEFTVQGYIVCHGHNKKGALIFKKETEEIWNTCVEDYKKYNADCEDDDCEKSLEKLEGLKTMMSQLNEVLNSNIEKVSKRIDKNANS
jgi:hypothetical protein